LGTSVRRSISQFSSKAIISRLCKELGNFYDESGRLAAITTDILEDTGAVVSATPFPAGAYRERSGFVHELRKDGVDL
jgi:hypothetical protein